LIWNLGRSGYWLIGGLDRCMEGEAHPKRVVPTC